MADNPILIETVAQAIKAATGAPIAGARVAAQALAEQNLLVERSLLDWPELPTDFFAVQWIDGRLSNPGLLEAVRTWSDGRDDVPFRLVAVTYTVPPP